jgi:hypothetical protein
MVMMVTCVSVGSGKASMVRSRNDRYPQMAMMPAKKSTAVRFLRLKLTSRSNMAHAHLSPDSATWFSNSSAPRET